MEEYRKIDWRIRDLDYHEKTHEREFIPNDYLSMLYLHQGFIEKKAEEGKPDTAILTKPTEPYVPGKKLYVNPTKRSLLTKRQQSQCLAALKRLRSGKDSDKYTKFEQINIDVYKKLQEKIAVENAKYLVAAKNVWLKKHSNLTGLKPAAYKHMKLRWRRHVTRFADYKPFYKDLKMISLSYTDEEAPVEMVMTQNVLEVGTVAKCALPTLTCAFTLKLSTFPDEDGAVSGSSKCVVSRDKNVENILSTNPADVVISSGGLHRILDNTDFGLSWDVPVIVKEIEIEQGEERIKKRVAFVDKPLPLPHPTKADFSRICHKLLLKSNLCEFEAFTFPNADLPVENVECSIPEEKCDEQKGKKLHHNVSYRLWRLSNKTQNQDILMKTNKEVKTINLLVRTKLDGCEISENGALQPVIVTPKMEYQLDFGGSVASKSELSREWTSLFFRPFSKLYRVRIDGTNYQVVMNESCSMQKINTEAMVHYQYKPHLSLGVLHKVCVELAKLEPGNYMLHHTHKHGAFVGLLKASSESEEDCYDLLKKYQKCTPYLTAAFPWNPIDLNLVLPMHEAYDRMPGLFQAGEAIQGKGKKKKNKGKKAKK